MQVSNRLRLRSRNHSCALVAQICSGSPHRKTTAETRWTQRLSGVVPFCVRRVSAVLICLTCLFAALARTHAENAVVLESFEDNIACASPVSNPGSRPSMTPAGVSLTWYVKQDNEDENVSHGRKSLKIVLSSRQKHSPDFQIKLSDEASAKVRAAMASPDVARYILRYDLIFPPL